MKQMVPSWMELLQHALQLGGALYLCVRALVGESAVASLWPRGASIVFLPISMPIHVPTQRSRVPRNVRQLLQCTCISGFWVDSLLRTQDVAISLASTFVMGKQADTSMTSECQKAQATERHKPIERQQKCCYLGCGAQHHTFIIIARPLLFIVVSLHGVLLRDVELRTQATHVQRVDSCNTPTHVSISPSGNTHLPVRSFNPISRLPVRSLKHDSISPQGFIIQ